MLLRSRGVDVRAVTAWSLFGAFGWSSLLTGNFDQYETGAFDLSSGTPRPTALAGMIQALATAGTCDHAALDGEGWWRQDSRLAYPPHAGNSRRRAAEPSTRHHARPLLIAGSGGTLGYAFSRVAAERGLAAIALSRGDLDVSKREEVRARLRALRPWAVVNAAGYVRVDDAETDPVSCRRVNTSGAVILAEECEQLGIRAVSFSSDLVFDGETNRRYIETDPVNPLGVYGASKAAAEAALQKLSNTLIVRTSAFFGPWDSANFLAHLRRALQRGATFPAASDLVVSPTYVPDLVNVCLDLLIDGERGIWHLANDGELTWAEFGAHAARASRLDPALVIPVPAIDLKLRARRPAYSALASTRGSLMPSLDDAIGRCLAESEQMIVVPAAQMETVDV
jgi:dTDP-4-dehydrorhamnose reductase